MKMAENELTYTIPLRRNWMKAVRYKRGQNAIKTIREFLKRHTKADEIKIGRYLNEYILSRGFRHPPHKVQVKAVKEKIKVKDKEIEILRAEWINAPVEKKEIKKIESKEAKKVEEKKETENVEKKTEIKEEKKAEKPAKEIKRTEEKEKIEEVKKVKEKK